MPCCLLERCFCLEPGLEMWTNVVRKRAHLRGTGPATSFLRLYHNPFAHITVLLLAMTFFFEQNIHG